jgi:hypothetical protein
MRKADKYNKERGEDQVVEAVTEGCSYLRIAEVEGKGIKRSYTLGSTKLPSPARE